MEQLVLPAMLVHKVMLVIQVIMALVEQEVMPAVQVILVHKAPLVTLVLMAQVVMPALVVQLVQAAVVAVHSLSQVVQLEVQEALLASQQRGKLVVRVARVELQVVARAGKEVQVPLAAILVVAAVAAAVLVLQVTLVVQVPQA